MCTATLAKGLRLLIESLMRCEQRLGRLRPLEAFVSPTDFRAGVRHASLVAFLMNIHINQDRILSATAGMYYHCTIWAHPQTSLLRMMIIITYLMMIIIICTSFALLPRNYAISPLFCNHFLLFIADSENYFRKLNRVCIS